MCVCAHVRAYVCVRACVSMRVYVCLRACARVRVYVCVYACACKVRVRARVPVCVRARVREGVCFKFLVQSTPRSAVRFKFKWQAFSAAVGQVTRVLSSTVSVARIACESVAGSATPARHFRPLGTATGRRDFCRTVIAPQTAVHLPCYAVHGLLGYRATDRCELQALVYDILPSTTAVFSYATGSRKLSANEQFFVGTQTDVRLLQTTQIISDVCFITYHVTYASSNQNQIRLNRDGTLFLPGVDAPHVYVRALDLW